MAIASAIFWVMVGVAYIVYQCFKARPKETTIVIASLVIVMVCIAALYAVTSPLKESSPELAWVLEMTLIGLALFFLLRRKKADDKKAKQEHERIMHKSKKDLALRKLAEHLANSTDRREE